MGETHEYRSKIVAMHAVVSLVKRCCLGAKRPDRRQLHQFGNDKGIALVVTSGSNSYLKFSLANLPPGTAGSNIAGASAVLFVDAVLKSGTMDVYALNSPWSENSLTYNTAPNADGSRAHRHVEYVYRRSDRQRQANRVRRCAIC
jgi:ethanolamine utilization microcompartment shell protein EutL